MKILHLSVGRLQTNCYIVWAEDSNRCAVIDPGDEADRILKNMEDRALTLDAIMLTHGHFDHVGAVKTLCEKTGCKVYMNIKELALPQQLTGGKLCYTDPYGDTVTAGGLTFHVLETPGHSEGSVCLRCGDILFSGDTLFAGTCGRTDLPTGSWHTILKSLKMLAQLPGNYTVYPGHGPATNMAAERVSNPCIE